MAFCMYSLIQLPSIAMYFVQNKSPTNNIPSTYGDVVGLHKCSTPTAIIQITVITQELLKSSIIFCINSEP